MFALRPLSIFTLALLVVLCSTASFADERLAPNVKVDLKAKYPKFFAKWKHSNFSDVPPIHAGPNGEVVLYWDKDRAFATSDEGRTWSAYKGPLLWPEEGSFPVCRVGKDLVAIRAGKWVQRSGDNGKTWSKSQPIPRASVKKYPELKDYYTFSITTTSAGRIVIPEDYLCGREGPDPDVLFTNTSIDGGRTWRRSTMIAPPDPLPKKPEGFGEPAVVELSDGRLWIVFRSLYGHLWQAISNEGGLTWGPPSSTGLASPLSNVKAQRIPGTNAIVLIWNNSVPGPSKDFGSSPSIYRPRSPLVFAVSHDDCRSWTCPVMIEAAAGIYPQIHFTEKNMFVAYLSNPDPNVGSGAQYGLGLAVFDKQKMLALPKWTTETIVPLIKSGRVSHWLGLSADEPGSILEGKK